MEVSVDSKACETPIHATTWEYINSFLEYGYEVDDDIISAPNNKPSNTGDTDRPIYK